MRLSSPITALAASAALAFIPASSVLAQRQQPTPEQRIDRLEHQVQEMQRRVYPKGKPADTAGFSDDPAATQSSVMSLDQRLDSIERQMADMLRQTEENSNRLRSMETGLGELRTDENQRIQALEQRVSEAAAAAPTAVAADSGAPAAPMVLKARPKPSTTQVQKTAEAGQPAAPGDEGTATPATDAGEDAYTEGFHLWEAGKYDEAITTLKSFVSTYPKHRRVSYANNLIGRALLDKGDARAAATALLANYRTNPGGERAPDSLFYLGQALTKLGQTGQACKAYGELDAVYGAKIRPDLKKLETDAKAEASCS
ncbi:MAG TPA: tetratricopeptide repeat protein [Sphingomicrobium sp.]|nr:tetratricopeptide repeat protein [Sphingomicrobium sp.]